MNRLLFAGIVGSTCLVLATTCAVYHPIRVETPGPEPTTVESPVKVHLLDGTTIVYPKGLVVGAEELTGTGTRYDAGLKPAGTAGRVPLDSVAAMESFPGNLSTGRTVAYSAGAAVVGVVGSVALFKALFGSCPTIYAEEGGVPVLQAEAFSTSIAPLFESRDVDVLAARADPTGRLELEVRNEALETHYIDQVELIEVRHAPDERVLPDDRNRPVVVGQALDLLSVVDRAGRDLGAPLLRPEGEAFASDGKIRREVTAADFADWIDVAVAIPAGMDSVALVLRARNSLLNTILLYDVILGPHGARAVDWLGADLDRIGEAARLGRWYHRRSGIHVSIRVGNEWRAIGRIGDAGPIAWKDVALVIPTPPADTLHLRLSFVADQWRIDRLEVAGGIRRPETLTHAPDAVVTPDGTARPDALVPLAASDGQRLATTPGQRFRVRFETGARVDGHARTFLVAMRGYYVEWIRGDWIRSAARNAGFVPADEAMVAALARWEEVRDDFEGRFFGSRVPVR